MNAARALAELLDASPQVAAATIFGRDDEQLGSVGLSAGHATEAAVRAGRTLLADAGEFRGVGEATQVHASLAGGDVFVVGRHGGPAIVAITGARQSAGLVFHNLKNCLSSVEESRS